MTTVREVHADHIVLRLTRELANMEALKEQYQRQADEWFFKYQDALAEIARIKHD